MSDKKKEFTGAWVAKSILASKDLTATDKLLLGYMLSFGEFFASNAHVAMRLGVGESTVANAMVRLRRKGYIKGRTPLTATSKPTLPETVSGVTGISNIEKSVEKSLEKRYCSATPNKDGFPSLEEALRHGKWVSDLEEGLLEARIGDWHVTFSAAPPDRWRPHLKAFLDKIESDRRGW